MIKLSALLILLLLAAPPREDDARRQDSLQRARMAEYFMAEDQEGFIKAARELVNYHLEKGSDKQLFDVQGTGLGLSICRDIAGRLGGRVWLDTAYSPGARFVFTVPVER